MKNITQILLGGWLVGVVGMAAYAGCYVCGGRTCVTSNGGCTLNGTVTRCELAPYDAPNGVPGKTGLTPSARNALCYNYTSSSSTAFYQGPCSENPSGYTPLGLCGTSSLSVCCYWRNAESMGFTTTNAGYQIKDCTGDDCTGQTR